MPTYVYRCTECDHEFEEFQLITEKPIETCPACGGKTERVISGGAGFLFKGSGFYVTDYRSEQYRKDAAREKGERSPASDKKTKPSPKSDSRDKSTKPTSQRPGSRSWRSQGR